MSDENGFAILLLGCVALLTIVLLAANFCTPQDHYHDLKPYPQETR